MNPRRLLPVLVLVVVVLATAVVVLAAGERGGGGAPAAGAGTVIQPVETVTVPAGTSTAPAATGDTPASPHCTTADLAGSIRAGDAGAGQQSAVLVLQNVSGSACHTRGYPGLGLVGAGGTTLPSTVVWGGAGDAGRATVELAAGASASARMQWSDMPGSGDAAGGPCQPVAATLLVTPPDERDALRVPFGQAVCERGHLTVTALVAGTGGPA